MCVEKQDLLCLYFATWPSHGESCLNLCLSCVALSSPPRQQIDCIYYQTMASINSSTGSFFSSSPKADKIGVI